MLKGVGKLQGLSLRGRLFGVFAVFLLLVLVPMLALFLTVRTAYRELADMQGRQAEVARLVELTNQSWELYSKYHYSKREADFALFWGRFQEIRAVLVSFDRQLPDEVHYIVYDLQSMASSFGELSLSIHDDVLKRIPNIYIDKRSGELARLRDYLLDEYAHLLTTYLEHVGGRALALRNEIEGMERVIAAIMAVVLLIGALVASLLSSAIAKPVRALVDSIGRFAGGEMQSPLQSGGRRDEIGLLIEAFNGMTVQIWNNLEQLKEKAAMEVELKDHRMRVLEAENLSKQAEIHFLQGQVHPHFLNNALNSILALSRIEEAARTEKVIESLAMLMRGALKSGKSFVSLGEEFELVGHYLYIQQVRFGQRLSYRLDLPPELDQTMVPSMIVQPFVENAVIHGIEPQPMGGGVTVSASRDAGSGDVIIEVADNGGGGVPDACAGDGSLEDGRHIGILNTKRRLALLYGEGREWVEIFREPGCGTRVCVRIPERPPLGRSAGGVAGEFLEGPAG